MPLCVYCKYDFTMESSTRQDRRFCSNSCRVCYSQYEKQIRVLHQRMKDKIFVKPETIRVRKYREHFQVDKILYSWFN